MRSFRWVFSFLFFSQLIACSPAIDQKDIEFSTNEPINTQTPIVSILETKPTISTPVPTPTLIPLSLIGTPQTEGVEIITEENAIYLQEVARWGVGEFSGSDQSPDKQYIALRFTQGVIFVSANDLSTVSEIYTPFEVGYVCFANDREIAGIASSVGDVWIVNYTGGEVLNQFYYPTGRLGEIAISPDGNSILVGSFDGVILQPIDGGSPLKSPIYTAFANSLAFSPDGNLFAIGLDGQIEIWDFKAEKLLQVIESDWYVENLAFSPDATLLSAFVRNRLIIWKVLDGSTWATVMAINTDDFDPLHTVDPIYAISPDWSKAVIQYSTLEESSLRLVELPEGNIINEVVPENFPQFTAFIKDGNSIITILKDSGSNERFTLASWNINEKSLNLLKTISSQVTRLAVSPNSDLVAVGFNNGQVRLLSASNGNLIYEFPIKHDLAVSGLQFIDQGEKLTSAGGGQKNILLVWDIVSREKIKGFDAPEEFISEAYQSRVILSADGKSIVLSYFQGDGRLNSDDPVFYDTWYSTDNGEIIASLKIEPLKQSGENAYISGYPSIDPEAISPDGKSVIAFAAFVPWVLGENGYYLWTTDSPNGKKIIGEEVQIGESLTPNLGDFVFNRNPDLLIFSPDGRWLGASQGTKIKIWEVGTWKTISAFSVSDEQDVSTTSSTPNKSPTVASTPLRSFDPISMPDSILAMQFSNDGELVATAGENGIIRIWRVADGEILAVVPPVDLQGDIYLGQTLKYYPSIITLAFSADGTRLYAGDDLGVVHVYAINP